MTVRTGFKILYNVECLCHAVNGNIQTGYLSGNGVLVINTLVASFIHSGSSINQCFLSGGLIVSVDSSINLLYSGLNAGLDCLVTGSLCLVNQNTLLCRFNVCQDYTSIKNRENIRRILLRTRTI